MYAILVMVFILSVYCINVISCTCGVIHGIASFDGRAIVWKNRDISGINQKIFFKTGPAYQYLAVGGTDTRMGLNTKGLAIGHSIVEDLRVSFINNVKNHDYILGNLCSLSQCTTVLGQQARGIAKYYDGTPSMTAPIVDGFGNAIYLEVGDKFNVVNENGDSVPPFFCYNPLDFGPNKARKQAVVVRTNYTHKNSSGQDDSTSSDKRFIDGRTNLQNAVGDDGVTIQELIQVSRYGNPGTGAYRTTCGLETRCAMLAHTVNKGEDPRIAMMWVALGNPDYTPFIPVWVENGIKGDLLNVQTTYITDSLHHFIDFATILYNNRDSSDYDKYVNQRFEPLEENFINAVTEARKRWFESGFVYSEAKSIYTHSAATGWQTLKTISLQSKINKRSLNSTPTITNIQAQIQGNSVLFSHNGNDPDGNITNTLWDFGDGNVSNNANPTHNYTSSGTYLVMCKITDNNGSCNARWKYITVSPTLTEKHSNNDVFKNIQISPNPFNPGTSIQIVGGYSKNDVIKVSIFNNCGQLMDTFKSTYSGSTCVINWDASNRPGGLYFFKVDNGKQIKTAKAMLLN